MTDFLLSHPGGAKIILRLAGRDATEEYNPVHLPGTLQESLKPEAKLGTIRAVTPAQPDSSRGQDKDHEGFEEQPVKNLLNLDEL